MDDARAFAPLRQTRVLELTTSLAGPYCGLILASLGADVVKLEPPGSGDDTRSWGPPFWNDESAAFLAVNAGKRSIAVDLKSEQGIAVARQLAGSADVVLQNLRPGLVERLGLGFDDLASDNPRLVYCSIGAFGARGPLSREPGYDPLMQAAGGIMSLTGEPGREAVRAGPSIVDQGTGMWAAIGVLAALRARDAGAGPQLVDTSLYETAVNWVPYQLVGYLGSGTVPRALGSSIGILAPYRAYPSGDGQVMIAAANDRLFARLCGGLGVPQLALDPRFATNADRVTRRDELDDEISRRTVSEDTATWVTRLREAGIPVAPIEDMRGVVESEQTSALGLLQHLPSETIPDLQVVAPPLSVAGDRVGFASPPPRLGQHSRELLRECGLGQDEIDALLASGAVAEDA